MVPPPFRVVPEFSASFGGLLYTLYIIHPLVKEHDYMENHIFVNQQTKWPVSIGMLICDPHDLDCVSLLSPMLVTMGKPMDILLNPMFNVENTGPILEPLL